MVTFWADLNTTVIQCPVLRLNQDDSCPFGVPSHGNAATHSVAVRLNSPDFGRAGVNSWSIRIRHNDIIVHRFNLVCRLFAIGPADAHIGLFSDGTSAEEKHRGGL